MVYKNVVCLCGLLLLCTSGASAQSPSSNPQFCQSIRSLLQASYSDFNAIKRNVTRHSDGSTDWLSSIVVAGSTDCEGQSDPDIASSISCTIAESQSQEQLTAAYQEVVSGVRSCLDRTFVLNEEQGGKPTRLSTPITEASFEKKATGTGPDGPTIRVSLGQWHSAKRSAYELVIWIDARDKE